MVSAHCAATTAERWQDVGGTTVAFATGLHHLDQTLLVAKAAPGSRCARHLMRYLDGLSVIRCKPFPPVCIPSHGTRFPPHHCLQSRSPDGGQIACLPHPLMKAIAMTATTSIYNSMTTEATSDNPLGQRILRFPLTRILLGIVFFMLPFLLIQAGALHFFDAKWISRLGQFFGVCMGCLSYALYVTKVERRAVSELSLKGSAKEYGTGFLVGGLMICASVAGIASLGGLRILSFTPNTMVALPLVVHMTVSIIEEMLLRVIIFRVLQESLGTWLALAASSLVFGAMHLINDNVSVLGIANVTAAGALLAAAYLLTGRLWLCAGLHAASNFFQEGIFAIAVSGHAVKTGLLLTERSGPDWLTGGAFGIEGSAVDLAVVVLVTVGMLVLAQRGGRWVRPFWKG